MKKLLLAAILFIAVSVNAVAQKGNVRYAPPAFNPASTKLYPTIARLDSLYFGAYNTGQATLIDSLTAENLEFYHDRGGIMTSKADYLASLKKYIYGKVTRKLTSGSLEVYEIPGFGAIEFGYHSFNNKAEPGESQPSKFVIIWQLKDNRWKVSRVISLH